MTGGTDGGTRATTRTGRPLACVVVNPSKPRATAAVRSLLEGELREAGYAGPVWLETSVSEPGTMQARLALAAGASLVVAAGGDGTVRSVAAGLASTGAQMGIVLLARRTWRPATSGCRSGMPGLRPEWWPTASTFPPTWPGCVPNPGLTPAPSPTRHRQVTPAGGPTPHPPHP